MTGTILNVGAIIAGGVAGLALAKEISPATQVRLKYILGVLTIYAGFSTTWNALHGGFWQLAKQGVIMLVSLVLGNVIGKTLRLQKNLNRLGEYAQDLISRQSGGSAGSRFSEGFTTCTVLFCVGPMSMLGAIQDGLSGNFRILAIKSVMDGLATMGFVKTFGWGPMLAAIPVLAYQGCLTMAARSLDPYLHNQAMLDSINATGGLLVLCISLVVLELAKVPLTDYLPSLAVAPLLTWLW